MEPVHLPEDDEEFHDAPEAAQAAHPATNGDQQATQHSDDEQDAFHDAIEDASHGDHGANPLHSPAQPTHDTTGAQSVQGHSRDNKQPTVSATSIVEEPFDSDADADGFVSSSDRRDGAAAAHEPDSSFPADDQFRPYADQQPVAGQVADDEEAEAEALTPEEAQVTRRRSAVRLYMRPPPNGFVRFHDGERGAEEQPLKGRSVNLGKNVFKTSTEMLMRPASCRSDSKRRRPSKRRATTCTGRATRRPRRCARPAAVMTPKRGKKLLACVTLELHECIDHCECMCVKVCTAAVCLCGERRWVGNTIDWMISLSASG